MTRGNIAYIREQVSILGKPMHLLVLAEICGYNSKLASQKC